jgi:hypothetical protein
LKAVCSAQLDDFRFLSGVRTLGVVPVAVPFLGVFALPFLQAGQLLGEMFLSTKIRSNADASHSE